MNRRGANIERTDESRAIYVFDEGSSETHVLGMKSRRRLLIAIERNELRFWKLVSRALARLRERSLLAGARVDDDLEAAMRWAADAQRARREEIAHLSRSTPAETAAPRSEPSSNVRESGVRWAA